MTATPKEERILAAIFACGSADCPKPFALYRSTDVTGVSGEGTVAHGAQFADGTVVIRWLGEYASTVIWDSLDAAINVHGHDGRTRVVWLAADFSEMALAESEAAAAERARIEGLFGDWIDILMSEPNSHPPAHWKAGFADLIQPRTEGNPPS